MHLVLTGATGLVGSGVLHHILSLSSAAAASKNINRLSIISRRPEIPLLSHPDRPTENKHTKIEVITHKDFKSYPKDLLSRLGDNASNEDDDDNKLGVIWALGISQTQVKTAAEYEEITKDYTLEAAKALSTLSTTAKTAKKVNFVYVSGEGASHSPGFFTPLFGRVKGATELELLELMKTAPFSDTLKVYLARPAGVDAVHQSAVAQLDDARDSDRTFGTRLAKTAVLPLMRRGVFSSQWSPTDELGAALVDLAVGDGAALTGSGTEGFEGRVVRAAGLRRLAAQLSE